jgi:hypothetical protein
MLGHRANSHCSKPSLRLREGRLFLVETTSTLEPPGAQRTYQPFAAEKAEVGGTLLAVLAVRTVRSSLDIGSGWE